MPPDAVALNSGSSLVLLVAAGVLLTYFAAYLRARPEPLPLLRHPLALSALAARRLWLNRSLLWWVLGLTLVSQLVHPLSRLHGYPHDHVFAWWSFAAADSSWYVQWVLRGAVSLGLSSLPNWRTTLPNLMELLPLALGFVLLHWSWRRPAWLNPGLQRRARSLGLLVVGCFLLQAVCLLLIRQFVRHAQSMLLPAHALLIPGDVGLAAWTVVGWSLIWQVARGGRWNWREALRDVLRCGWAAAAFVAGAALLAFAGVFVVRLDGGGWLVRLLLLPVSLLFLLPWVLVGEGRGLAETWRETLDLWRRNGADLALFLLRYAAVFFPVNLGFYVLTRACLSSEALFSVFPALPLGWLQATLNVLMALTAAVFYAELRKQRREAAEPGQMPPPPERAIEPALET
ncbi:MAG TPA: hypothetical protein VGM19_10810 [Armatimonadota bacterium]|jgi:hypothetical protein